MEHCSVTMKAHNNSKTSYVNIFKNTIVQKYCRKLYQELLYHAGHILIGYYPAELYYTPIPMYVLCTALI